MLRAIKYELRPNATQRSLINRTCGCCRFVYNEALAFTRENKVTNFTLRNRLPELKTEHEWLKEVPAAALQQSIIDLGKAFKNKWNGRSGWPVFHRKGNDESFRIPVPCRIDYSRYRVSIPKLGSVKFYKDKPIDQSKIHSFTVSRTTTDRYYISILYEAPDRVPLDNGQAVGICGISSRNSLFIDRVFDLETIFIDRKFSEGVSPFITSKTAYLICITWVSFVNIC